MQSNEEIEAAIIASHLNKFSESDRREMEERLRESYEVDKIEALGKECRRFLDSPVGRFILNEAVKQEQNAVMKFKALKMADFKTSDHYLDAVKELQFEMDVPARIFTFLDDAIRRAKEETELFNEERT